MRPFFFYENLTENGLKIFKFKKMLPCSLLSAQKQDTFQRLNCKTNIKSKFHQESFSKVWNLSSQMELGKGCLQFNKKISPMLTQGWSTIVAIYLVIQVCSLLQ